MFNFHHVGYVVDDLQSSVKQFSLIGYNSSKEYIDNIQDIKIIILEKANSPIIELILPISKANPLKRFLGESDSPSPYHVAYTVEDIDKSSAYLRSNSFIATMKIAPSVAFNNKPFTFFYSRPTGLIEIIEGQ
jgi:hypothetical protein